MICTYQTSNCTNLLLANFGNVFFTPNNRNTLDFSCFTLLNSRIRQRRRRIRRYSTILCTFLNLLDAPTQTFFSQNPYTQMVGIEL